MASSHVVDVATADFEREVVERSHDVPVVVDFWAAWCGPCRTLGPLLEEAVGARDGQVVLAKVDVDANPDLARRFDVHGIPAVKAFRDGQVVDQFVGALPRAQVESFVQQLVPTPADRAAAEAGELAATDPEAAESAYRGALELDPNHRAAAVGLAGLLAEREPEAALELVTPHRPARDAEEVAARASFARLGGADVDDLRARVEADPADADAQLGLGEALAARGDYEEAVERLLEAVERGGDAGEVARKRLLALFRVIGDGHALVRSARRRLASVLY